MRKRSHSRAAPRPSFKAHTTRLWPRRLSPATAAGGEGAEGVGVHGEDALGAGDVLRNDLPLVVARPFDLHGVDGFDVAVFVAVVT